MISMQLSILGCKIWYLNETRHRANGPAIVLNRDLWWWCWHDEIVDEYEHMMLSTHGKSND